MLDDFFFQRVCGEIAGTSSIDNSNVPYDRYYDYS